VKLIGDEIRISQILINLLTNAIKFNSNNGTITVALDIKPIPSSKDTDNKSDQVEMYISVSDTGPGIDSEDRLQLFNRFKQIYHHDPEYCSGSGLGLFISKNLVDLMHGKIWVESQPGNTTFTFKIPCQVYATSINEDANAQKNIIAADNYAIRKQQQDEKDNQKIKILVVEDNVINQKLLKRFIERAGHTCIIAENGQEAIDMYQENNIKDNGDKNHQKIDLIFMDIEMPVMDGLLATLNIRQLEKQQQKEKGDKFSPVIIIGLSGNARSQYIKLAMDSGMDDYMTKPVTAQQIVDIIRKFISQKSQNSDNQQQ